MDRKILDELEAARHARLWLLAMQLMVQVCPACETQRDMDEVLANMRELSPWNREKKDHPVFKVVG